MQPGPLHPPYIANTGEDRRAMLEVIGADSVDALFADIPEPYRNPTLGLGYTISHMW